MPLDEGEADRFRAQAAALVPAERLRGAIGRARSAGNVVDTLAGAGGACPALAEDQRCLIHATHGAEAKPRACQIFPYTFVATPAGVRVGVSWACPAVVDGEGAPLAEQAAEIEALFHASVNGTRWLLPIGETVALAPGVTLAFADAAALVEALAAAVEEPGPFARRACRAGALCAIVQARLGEGRAFAIALADARAGREALVDEALAEPAKSDRLSRALLRTICSSASAPAAGWKRFTALFGGETLRPPGLPAGGEALLARWLSDGLRGFTFFGVPSFGLSIAAGLDLQVLAAAGAIHLQRQRDGSLDDLKHGLRRLEAALHHRANVPGGFERALARTASLDLLREELG